MRYGALTLIDVTLMVRVWVVGESEFFTKNEIAFVCCVIFVGGVYVSSRVPSMEYVVVGGVAPLFAGTIVPATPTAVPTQRSASLNPMPFKTRTVESENNVRPHSGRVRERTVGGS